MKRKKARGRGADYPANVKKKSDYPGLSRRGQEGIETGLG